MQHLIDFYHVDEIIFNFGGHRLIELKKLQRKIVRNCERYDDDIDGMNFGEWVKTYIIGRKIKWLLFDMHLGYIGNYGGNVLPFILSDPDFCPLFFRMIHFYNHEMKEMMIADFRVDRVLPPPVYDSLVKNEVILVGEAISCTGKAQFLANKELPENWLKSLMR